MKKMIERIIEFVILAVPYVIAALFIVSLALLIKWCFVLQLGAAMPDHFLTHAILVLAALVLSCGLTAFIVLILSFAAAFVIGITLYLKDVLAKHFK